MKYIKCLVVALISLSVGITGCSTSTISDEKTYESCKRQLLQHVNSIENEEQLGDFLGSGELLVGSKVCRTLSWEQEAKLRDDPEVEISIDRAIDRAVSDSLRK